MADSAEVVGDELVVVHNQETVRLSLAVSLEQADVWLNLDTTADDRMGWREFHSFIRDRIMPESARAVMGEVEANDFVWAVALGRRWVAGLNERLGKALSLSLFGVDIVQPSPPTSGSGTGSVPTGSGSTAGPKPRSRTRKLS